MSRSNLPIPNIINDTFSSFNFQVLHVKMSNNIVESISEVFVDDGSEAIGSSSATFINGRIVIGTVDDQTLICEAT